jgi:hypothetical protein
MHFVDIYKCTTEISFQSDASQTAHINLVHFNLMHFVDIYASQRFHFNPMHRESSYKSGAFQSDVFCTYIILIQFDTFCTNLCIMEIYFYPMHRRDLINLVHLIISQFDTFVYIYMHFVHIYASQRYFYASRRYLNSMHHRELINLVHFIIYQFDAFLSYLWIDASQRAHQFGAFYKISI